MKWLLSVPKSAREIGVWNTSSYVSYAFSGAALWVWAHIPDSVKEHLATVWHHTCVAAISCAEVVRDLWINTS